MILRVRMLLALILTVLVLFTGRLVYLQLAMAEEFSARSEQNFTQQVRIPPLRGRIIARDGTVLADNRVAYDLLYRGGPITGWSRLKHLLSIDGEPRQPDPTDPDEARFGAVLAWNIPDALIPAVEERVAGQPNLVLRERIERTYPTNLAAQTVGYTGLADPQRHPGYGVDDLIGVSGIEAGLEPVLYGVPGAKLIEVDHRNVPLRETELWPAQPGQDVAITIDPNVQRMAEDALAGALTYVNAERRKHQLPTETVVRGAILAMDPRNGDILAMASAPTFDQNVFTHRPSDPEAVREVLEDSRNLPLQNRAIEAYPPASTFKLVSSSTLLEHGYISPSTRYECTAAIRFGGITWENWYPGYRGNYTVAQAIADSCNTFYWRAALETPNFSTGWARYIQDLEARAREFGYGEPVGVGLREEKHGRVPNQEWVRAQTGEPWYPGYTLNTSIGQGDVLATPLQTLQFIGTLANAGTEVKPRLVRAVNGVETPVETRQVDGRHWATLKDGMRRMITDHGSSAILGPRARFPVAVAGKTGTAQNPRGLHWEHVWFMGYAPAEAPEIAIVVFLEYAGSSSAVAVPVARDFLVGYFDVPTRDIAPPQETN